MLHKFSLVAALLYCLLQPQSSFAQSSRELNNQGCEAVMKHNYGAAEHLFVDSYNTARINHDLKRMQTALTNLQEVYNHLGFTDQAQKIDRMRQACSASSSASIRTMYYRQTPAAYSQPDDDGFTRSHFYSQTLGDSNQGPVQDIARREAMQDAQRQYERAYLGKHGSLPSMPSTTFEVPSNYEPAEGEPQAQSSIGWEHNYLTGRTSYFRTTTGVTNELNEPVATPRQILRPLVGP